MSCVSDQMCRLVAMLSRYGPSFRACLFLSWPNFYLYVACQFGSALFVYLLDFVCLFAPNACLLPTVRLPDQWLKPPFITSALPQVSVLLRPIPEYTSLQRNNRTKRQKMLMAPSGWSCEMFTRRNKMLHEANKSTDNVLFHRASSAAGPQRTVCPEVCAEGKAMGSWKLKWFIPWWTWASTESLIKIPIIRFWLLTLKVENWTQGQKSAQGASPLLRKLYVETLCGHSALLVVL